MLKSFLQIESKNLLIRFSRMKFFIAILFFFCLCNYGIAQEMNLNKEFLKIEEYLSVMEKTNVDVSEAPIKWHLLHILQVISGVINEAVNSNTDEFSSKSNIKWWFVSTFGKIPRGKVKAPDAVNPNFDITEEDIQIALENAKLSLSEWSKLEKNNFYVHHILLHLNKRKIKRFLKVHTRHHLRIISDIVK